MLPGIDNYLLFANSLTVYQGIFESGGKNRHEVIDRWNARMDVPLGSAWCMSFQLNVYLDVCEVQGLIPNLYLSAGVRTFFSKNKHLTTRDLRPGLIGCLGLRGTEFGHAFGVLEKKTEWVLKTCEGNTSSKGSGVNREGDGVYIKTRDMQDLGDFDLLGFIDPFKNIESKK